MDILPSVFDDKSDGFSLARVISPSFIAIAEPPRAAALADTGIDKNSYTWLPPICAELKKGIVIARKIIIVFKFSYTIG